MSGRESAFLCCQYTVMDIVVTGDGMSIRINGYQNIFFQGILDPSPVHIEAARMGIQFDHHTRFAQASISIW